MQWKIKDKMARWLKKKWLENGTILDSSDKIHDGAVQYFKNFLDYHQNLAVLDISHLISRKITKEENETIEHRPTEMEMKNALTSIPYNSSSPRPDGFGSGFFIACWDFINEDLLGMQLRNFLKVRPPRFYTSSFIVLILKVMDPTDYDKFISISLFLLSIIFFSKIIVNWTTNCLKRIISPKQGAFILRRRIFENITLA